MLRIVLTALYIFIGFLLQSSVLDAIALGGVAPNLLILLVAIAGFMRGERAGLIVGCIMGILCDIYFGTILGFYALIYMYIGYINGKFSAIFYPEDIKLPLGLILTSDLSLGLVNYCLLFLVRNRLDFSYYFSRIILPEAIYTLFLTLPVYPLVLFCNTKLEEHERKGAKKFV